MLSVLLQALLSLNYKETFTETAIDSEVTHNALFTNESISTEGPNLPRKPEHAKEFRYNELLKNTYVSQLINRSGDISNIRDMLQIGNKIWFLTGSNGDLKINTYNTNGTKDEEKGLEFKYHRAYHYFKVYDIEALPDGSIIIFRWL